MHVESATDRGVNPNVAKAGGLQSRGAEGEAVETYCEPLATKDLDSSGFPARVNNVEKSAYLWNLPSVTSRKWCIIFYIDNNNGPLSVFCHFVYATLR